MNLDGQVVGINSAIATASSTQGQGGSIGLGFAIPIDQATRVAQEIMQNGSATKPLLGVTGSVQQSSSSGAQIGTVQAGSPAEKAGLAAGDVVTKVGDAKVEDFADLIARIGSYAPGQQVTLTVQSGGASETVRVTLGSQPDKAATTGTGGESQNPFGCSRGPVRRRRQLTHRPTPLQQGDIAPTESQQCHPAAFCLATARTARGSWRWPDRRPRTSSAGRSGCRCRACGAPASSSARRRSRRAGGPARSPGR